MIFPLICHCDPETGEIVIAENSAKGNLDQVSKSAMLSALAGETYSNLITQLVENLVKDSEGKNMVTRFKGVRIAILFICGYFVQKVKGDPAQHPEVLSLM